MFNNNIAEVARLLGFQSMSSPDISKNQLFEDPYGNSYIQIPNKLNSETIKVCLDLNSKKIIHPKISITPIHYEVADTIFNITKFNKNRSSLQEYQNNHHRDFAMLHSDFEALGEHNTDKDNCIYDQFESWLEFLELNNYEFISIDDAPKYTTNQQKYNVPFDLASANDEQSLVSWRGNYLQEKAHIKLIELTKIIEPLYSDNNPKAKEWLDAYRKLTTTDHYYYLADLKGQMGEFHEMFSPYNSREEAFEAISFAINFVTKEIEQYLELNS
ncbi:hypothetical protein HC766_00910 [Candidatus Gracilibacteria bacterium]|nr:hypothetical protein [Candidatus Gracilibacteria bacterium]NJS40940.1 hypothetical protein [Candidatus Gracilibacteria bacterium]